MKTLRDTFLNKMKYMLNWLKETLLNWFHTVGRVPAFNCCRKLSSVWYVVCEMFVVNHVNVEICTVFIIYILK